MNPLAVPSLRLEERLAKLSPPKLKNEPPKSTVFTPPVAPPHRQAHTFNGPVHTERFVGAYLPVGDKKKLVEEYCQQRLLRCTETSRDLRTKASKGVFAKWLAARLNGLLQGTGFTFYRSSHTQLLGIHDLDPAINSASPLANQSCVFVLCHSTESNLPSAPRLDDDAYDEGPPAFALGEMAKAAEELMARRWMNWVYGVYITPTRARIYRFDASGVTVTRYFGWRDDPWLLKEFLFRFALGVGNEGRGLDPTVEVVQDEETIEEVKKHLRPWATYSVCGPDGKEEEKETRRDVVCIRVPSCDNPDDPDGDMTVYAWGSIRDPKISPNHKLTRITPIYLPDFGVHTLKDAWRQTIDRREEDVLMQLNDACVPNVPKFIWGGEFGGVVMDLFPPPATKEGERGGGETYEHHRFVMKGKPMRPVAEFGSVRELVRVVHHVYAALYSANQACETLHNNVNPRKMFVNENGDGVLVGWDHASTRTEVTRFHSQASPPFMSCRALRRGSVSPHYSYDDLESLVWSFVYVAARFVETETPQFIQEVLHDLFYVALSDPRECASNRETLISSLIGGSFNHFLKFRRNRILTNCVEACLVHLEAWIRKDFQCNSSVVLYDVLKSVVEAGVPNPGPEAPIGKLSSTMSILSYQLRELGVKNLGMDTIEAKDFTMEKNAVRALRGQKDREEEEVKVNVVAAKRKRDEDVEVKEWVGRREVKRRVR